MTVRAGLQVRGDHGFYQIDQTTFCLSIMAQGHLGSASYSMDPLGIGVHLYTFNYTGPETIFAFYLPREDTLGGVYSQTYSGGVWTVTFAVGVGAGGDPLVPSTIKWFALGRPKPIAGPGSGFLVFEDSGSPVVRGPLRFSTDWKTVCPTFSFTPGRKYAGIGAMLRFRRDLNSDQLSDLTWIYHAWTTMEGFGCYGGAPYTGELILYDDFGSGTGGGHTGEYSRSVMNPLYGVDVTEYL